MQMEVKVALNFLLSFLYDKLPRRRVNLFGDELEKYLIIKLANKQQQTNELEANCLSINFKSMNGDEIIDPCLLAAAKDMAIDIYEILECLPNRLKLFIRPGFVFYAVYNLMNEFEEMKILYDEKPASNLDIITTSKPVSNKLNFANLIDAKPFQPLSNMTTNELNINNTSSVYSPPPPHTPPIDNVFLNQVNSLNIKETSSDNTTTTTTTNNKQLFTTATFAQTKFGTTKKKNLVFSPTTSQQRPVKPQNPKMLSTEFSNYIKTKTELKNLLSNRQLNETTTPIFNSTTTSNLNEISNIFLKNLNESSQPDNASLAAKLDVMFQQQQQNQNSQLMNPSPIISPASSSSSVSSNYDLFANSIADDLEDNLINSYFNPLLSSASFLTQPVLSNSLLTFQANKQFAEFSHPIDFKFESDN